MGAASPVNFGLLHRARRQPLQGQPPRDRVRLQQVGLCGRGQVPGCWSRLLGPCPLLAPSQPTALPDRALCVRRALQRRDGRAPAPPVQGCGEGSPTAGQAGSQELWHRAQQGRTWRTACQGTGGQRQGTPKGGQCRGQEAGEGSRRCCHRCSAGRAGQAHARTGCMSCSIISALEQFPAWHVSAPLLSKLYGQANTTVVRSSGLA